MVCAESDGDIRHWENGEMPRLVGGGGEGMAQIARIEELHANVGRGAPVGITQDAVEPLLRGDRCRDQRGEKRVGQQG